MTSLMSVDSLFSPQDPYPAELEPHQIANVFDEDIFGAPKPHANSVLNPFVEQNVRFAYLTSIHSTGMMRREMAGFAR